MTDDVPGMYKPTSPEPNPKPSVTDLAVAAIRTSEATTDTARITQAISAVLTARPEGGLLDSHAVADSIVTWRSKDAVGTDWTQTKDYVQYRLREEAHVCGHATDGHYYLVHADKECSGTCKQRRAQHRPVERIRELCPHCYVALPLAGECGTCG